jgi:pimeloyl-[acyl-carrier protein] synthase
MASSIAAAAPAAEEPIMDASPVFDLNLATLAPLGDGMLSQLGALRERDPLFWSDTSHCWIVTGHAEVTEGFSGTLPLLNGKMEAVLARVLPSEELHRRFPHTLRYMPRILPNMDGEEHARIRRLFVKAFSRKIVEDQRSYVRERVGVILDRAAVTRELEFNENISRQLPGAVILRLLGMQESYLARLKAWTDGVTRALTSFDPQPQWLEDLEVVVSEMLEIFRSEIEERRQHPRNDFISALVHAVDQGDVLTVDEMIGALILVIIAGHDTTSNSMTLGVRALARNPGAWAALRAQPERSVDAVIELMRYSAMSAAQPRLAAQDFEWRGRKIRQHDLIMLMIAGGNRDPHVFKNPDSLELTRQNNDLSLTFGPGLHHCIGHLLAKLQLSEFFAALTQRFDGVEILREPQFVPNLVFRGVTRLDVRFHPRAG